MKLSQELIDKQAAYVDELNAMYQRATKERDFARADHIRHTLTQAQRHLKAMETDQ